MIAAVDFISTARVEVTKSDGPEAARKAWNDDSTDKNVSWLPGFMREEILMYQEANRLLRHGIHKYCLEIFRKKIFGIKISNDINIC